MDNSLPLQTGTAWRLTWPKAMVGTVLFLSFLVHMLMEVQFEYSDQDTLIYTLIGEGIFKYGEMPYSFVFDHKPLLTYFFYGPLAFLDLSFNRYVLFSIAAFLLLGLAARHLLLKKTSPLPLAVFALALASVGNVGFTGNTELIYVLFQFIAIGLLLSNRGSRNAYFLSAASAVAAFNVNYVSAVALAPAILFCIHTSSRSWPETFARTLAYGAFAIVCQCVILVAFALLGGDLEEYLRLQYAFLSGYSGEKIAPSHEFIVTVAASFALCGAGALAFKPAREHRATAGAMLVLMAFCALSFVLNGKYYPHYLFSLTAPAAVFLLTLSYEAKTARMTLTAALLVGATFQATYAFRHWQVPTESLSDIYADLRSEVEGKQVAAMNSFIVPFFFSDAVPAHPFVWQNHVRTMFAPNAWIFFSDELDLRPEYVLTQTGPCTEVAVCERIETDYTLIQSYGGDWYGARSSPYGLYRRND